MPRIATYESQMSLPNTITGGPRKDPVSAALVDGVEGLGDAVLALHDKQQKIKITEAETEFLNRKRAFEADYTTTRMGAGALEDKDKKVKSVFDATQEESQKWVGELAAKFAGPYRDAVTARLTGHQGSMLDHASAYQGQQIGVAEADAEKGAFAAATLEAQDAAQGPGDGLALIVPIVDRGKAMIAEHSRGRDRSAEALAWEQGVYEKAVIAKAATDPAGAKALLDAKGDIFAADERTRLAETVERKRVEVTVETLFAQADGMGRDQIDKLLEGVKGDKEVYTGARTRIEANIKDKEEAADRASDAAFVGYTQKFYDPGKPLNEVEKLAVSREIHDDPAFAGASEPKRLRLLALLAPDKASSEETPAMKVQKHLTMVDARVKVYQGKLGEGDARKMFVAGDITKEGYDALVTAVSEREQVPALGEALTVVRAKYDTVFKDPEQRAKFEQVFMNGVMDEAHKQQGKATLGFQQILTIADAYGTPEMVKKWWGGTGKGDAPYKKPEPPDVVAVKLKELRKQYPGASWNEASGVFVLSTDKETGQSRIYDPRERKFGTMTP